MRTDLAANILASNSPTLSIISITDISTPNLSEPIKPVSKPPPVISGFPKFERAGTKIEMAFSNTTPRSNEHIEKQTPDSRSKEQPPERPDSRITKAFSKAAKIRKNINPTKPSTAFVMNDAGFVKIKETKTPEAPQNNLKTTLKPWSNKKYTSDDVSKIPRIKVVSQIKSDIKDHIQKHIDKEKQPAQQNIKWATSKKEILDRQKKTSHLFSHLAIRTRQKTTLEDDFLPRNDKYFSDNLGFEDLDIILPKNSQSGYYYWIGKDYSNVYFEDFKAIDIHSTDQFSREEVPRMPWRDQAMVMLNESARDLARHFIQRWNQTKNEQCPDLTTYPYLMPKSYSEPIDYAYKSWMKNELFKCNVQVF